MKTIGLCQGCLAPVPADAPDGLCPACLARAAGQSTPSVKPLPGQARDFGDYELLEEIARGGMGVVYKARQISLNRIVAVKMILGGQLAGDAAVKRFRSEAEAVAQLQHPNIVAIHEVGEHAGQHYFSMDYVAGTSLAARFAKQPLPVGEAAKLLQNIAEAVQFAHQRGILHRDLKPANVLLDESGQPRITDFGLAKRLDQAQDLTASGALLGTPDFMSPEQAVGRQEIVGPESDVFSLGAMLYQMLTGRAPFHGASVPETLSRILQGEPDRPSRLNPRIPPDLETICLKCLEKRPGRRYATAGALAADLGRFLAHEAVSARRVSSTRQLSRWLMSRPKILGGLASALVLVVVWGGYALWTDNRILAWEIAHRGEARTNGEFLNQSIQLNTVFGTAILLAVMGRLAKRLAKRQRERVLTGRFISPLVLAAFGVAAIAGAAFSIWLGATEIESWRWTAHDASSLGSPKSGSPQVDGAVQVVSLVALAGALGGAAGIVWLCATMAATVWREHSFTFYLSAEEEQSALSQAERDHLRAAEKEYRDSRSIGYLLILFAFLILLVTFLYRVARPGAAWPFLLGELAAALLAVIATLPIGPWSSKWPRALRLLIVVFALLYAGGRLHSWVPYVGRGLQCGTILGVVIGQAIRVLRKKKEIVSPISESATLAMKQP